MLSKSDLKSSGLRSFPGRGEYEFAFQFWYCEPSEEGGGGGGGGGGGDKGLILLF